MSTRIVSPSPRRLFAEATQAYLRSLAPGGALLLLVTLLTGLVAVVALSLLPALARLQLPLVLDGATGGVSSSGFSLLLTEISVPGAIVGALLIGITYVALTRLLHSALTGARPRFGASFAHGLRRCGSAAVVVSAVALAVSALAVATPLLMLLGALGLLVVLIARIISRSTPLRTWWLVVAVIPLGAAAVFAWRTSLAVPLLALEDHGPVTAIKRSVRVTRGAPRLAPLCLVAAFAAYFAVQALVGLAGPAGAPAVAATLLSLFVQVLTFGFPMAVLVVLAHSLRDASHPITALPSLRRPLVIPATAGVATLALVLGFFTPVMPAASAFAAEDGVDVGMSEATGSEADGGDAPAEEDDTGEPESAGGTGETPPEEPPGDTPSTPTPLNFTPVLSVLEGGLTAPGDEITLHVEASTDNGGEQPYTFYFNAFLLLPGGEREQLNYYWPVQASGGGREASYPLYAYNVPELGVGQHRFLVETEYVAARGQDRQPGPTLELTHVVGEIDETTQVTLSANPASFVADESLVLTALVEGDGGPAVAGNVTFQRVGDGLDRAVTVDVDVTGTARATFSGLAVGTHSFEATYRFPEAGLIAASNLVQVTATPYPVTLALTSSDATTEYGREAGFAFTLQAPRGGQAPAGTVDLLSGSTVLDTVTLRPSDFASGQYRGSLSTDALELGAQTLTARYTSSDGQHLTASSAAVNHRITAVPVSIAISSNEGWVMPRGSNPVLTVSILAPEGSVPLPEGGALKLEIGDKTISVPLQAWQTEVHQQLYDVDADLDIAASLTGFTTHTAVPATANITMRAAQTQVHLSFSEPALPGEAQGFSAWVAGETSLQPLDGRVEVRVKGTSVWKPLILVAATQLDFSYVLGLGEHTIEARYVSTRPSEYADSGIVELPVHISRSLTTLTATPPASAPRIGETYQVTVTAENQDQHPVLPGPIGAVTAVRGGQVVASGELSGGTATLDIPASLAGSDALQFSYAGSDTHSSATAELHVHRALWAASASLQAAPAAAIVGERLTLVASVSSDAPAALASVVGGTVEFTRGGTVLGTATIEADGTATITTTATPTPGTDTLHARYLGSPGIIAETSAALAQTVSVAPTTLDFTVTPAATHSRDRVEIAVRVSADPRSQMQASGGSVTLTGSFVGSARAQSIGSDGMATFSVIAPFAEGQVYDFSLQYSGTAQLATSQASSTIRVDAAPVGVHIETPDRVVAGESAGVEVQLSTAGATPIPSSGNVDLYADGTLIASKALAAGAGGRVAFAVASPTQLAIGEHRLTARFRNAFGYAPTTSAAVGLTVLGRETEVRLALDPSDSTPRGVDVAATATVNVVWSDDTPYGQVWLRKADTGEVVGTASLSWSHADRSKATFTLKDLPIGVHEFTAEYLPSGASAAMNAGSVSAAQQLEVTGRAVTIVPFYGAPRIGQDAVVQIDVRDPNAAGGSAPGGEVDVLLGDTVVGTAITLRTDDVLRSRATVAIPLQKLTGGDQQFTVRFRSMDGVHSFAERRDTVRVTKLTPQLTVQAVGDLSRLKWGDDLYVNVFLNRSTEAGANAVQPPSGALTVRLGGGDACTQVVAQQYRCKVELPGSVTVIAEAAADGNYLAAEARLDGVSAGKRTPTLTVAVQPNVFPVETGSKQRLTWRLDGPQDGPTLRPKITGLSPAAVCEGEASGSCEFSFALATAGAPQQIGVAYPGDTFWEATTWQQSITPVGCYPLTLRADPLDAGTITVAAVDGAKCANGTGYRAGARVGVLAKPSASSTPGYAYQLDSVGGRPVTDAVGGLHWFTVGTGAGEVSQVVANFTSKAVCFPVTMQDLSLGSGYLGYTTLDTQPNCPTQSRWESGSSPQQQGWRGSTSVGWYLVGTQLTVTARPFDTGELYAARLAEDTAASIDTARWAQSMPQRFTVDRALRVQTRFGTPCLPVTLAAEGPGTVQAITQPNCNDEFRPGEYQRGTDVYWLAQPHADEYAYVASVTQAQAVTPLRAEEAARQGIARYSVTAFPGHHAATLRFDRCRTLTLANLSPELGTFSASGANCPVGSDAKAEEASGTYRFTPGSEVRLSAYVKGMHYAAPRFAGWKWPGAATDPALAKLNASGTATFRITEDLALRPSFGTAGECAPVTVASGDPLVEVMVAPTSKALERCAEGGLVAGWTGGALSGEAGQGSFIAKAQATDGNPQLGWVISGAGADPARPSPGAATPGATVAATGAGGRTLTAYSCQEVGAYIGLTDVTGEFGMARQRGGTFIEISPAPNCPFSPTAYTIGTELTISAGADERGYVFHGWGGVAVPGGDPRVASYTVQNDAPSVAVTALYEVVCHTLTIQGKAHRVTAMPAPNCPGAPADAPSAENGYTGSYIGGTPVALIGDMPGGNVWQGWRGDLVETGKVKVAVAIMDADKTAEHRYRGKSWDEKAVDFFEDMGDALAVAGKKMIGGVAYIAGKYAAEIPPLSLIGEAFEVISLVGEVLNFIGVPKSITKYFDYPAQTLDWVLSGFNCLASASLSSQNGSKSANLSDWADENQKAIDSTGGQIFRAIGIDPGDDNEMVGETLEKLYVTGKSLGYAQKYMGGGESIGKAMDAVDTGLEIYGMVTGPQGVGWDGSAKEAFDSSYGNHITGCMAAATPDFIRGALPISDDDFDRYEKEYGL